MKNDKEITDILIVCAGNVCRSPMAEAALRRKLFERGIDGIRVHSAGTHGGNIPYATEEAFLTAENHGLDLSHHRSRPLASELTDAADIILVMDRINHQWVLSRRPELEDKTFLITSFRRDSLKDADISDPYRLSLDFYETVFEMIDRSLDAFIDFLENKKK